MPVELRDALLAVPYVRVLSFLMLTWIMSVSGGQHLLRRRLRAPSYLERDAVELARRRRSCPSPFLF